MPRPKTCSGSTYRIDLVLSSNGVRDQEIDHSDSVKSSIVETLNELVSGVVGLWHEQVGRGLRDVGTTGQEADARASGTVGDTNSPGELNAV